MYSFVSLENIFPDLHCPVDQLHQGHDAHPGEEAEGSACTREIIVSLSYDKMHESIFWILPSVPTCVARSNLLSLLATEIRFTAGWK